MNDIILVTYFISLLILFAFGSHGFVMIFHYFKHRDTEEAETLPLRGISGGHRAIANF